MAPNMARHLEHLEPPGATDHDHPACSLKSQSDNQTGLRIASIFIVFAGALLGALLPVLLRRSASAYIPGQLFFAFKFVGTGVIIGTAWMHLLSPAIAILGDPCLRPRLGKFDWGSAVAGMTLMAMFLVHLLVTKLGPDTEADEATEKPRASSVLTDCSQLTEPASVIESPSATTIMTATAPGSLSQNNDPGNHRDAETAQKHGVHECHGPLAFATQLTAIFILEFGVIFHSVFIGLVLATTSELTVVLVVLVLHQLFEGLGLGARLALVSWPASRRWLPHALCLAFAVSTPLGTAVGLGARPGDAEARMLTNGVFDAVSAGILLYTGVFELMGREFFFNSHMLRATLKQQLFAYGYVAVGFTIMTVLAKWA